MQTCRNVIRNVADFLCHFGCEPPDEEDEDCEERKIPKCYHPPERSLKELDAKYKRIKIYDGSKNNDGNTIKRKTYKTLQKGKPKTKKKKCSTKQIVENTIIGEKCDEIEDCESSSEEECFSKSTQTDEKCKNTNKTEWKCGEDENMANCCEDQNDATNSCNEDEQLSDSDEDGEQNCDDKVKNEGVDHNEYEDNDDEENKDQQTKKCQRLCSKKKTRKRRRANSSHCKHPRKKQKKKESCSCSPIDDDFLRAMMCVSKKSMKNQMKSIEEQARIMWQSYSHNMPLCKYCNCKNSKWCKLLSHQKFPFYWAVLVKDFLSPTPYDNFLRFYLEENNLELHVLEDCAFKKSIEEIWKGLSKATKMPFITEAFLHRVSEGKVDLSNDCEIRDVFSKLLKNKI